MQWIKVDKNAHLRRDNDHVSVPAKYKIRLVGCGNFETTEGLRTDSLVADVDSHNVVCSWYFRGQEIHRILLYRIPAECIPEEGIAGGPILGSRVPIHGTTDAGRG